MKKVLSLLAAIGLTINALCAASTESSYINAAGNKLAADDLQGAFFDIHDGLAQYPANAALKQLENDLYNKALKKAQGNIKAPRTALANLFEDIKLLGTLMYDTGNQNWIDSFQATIDSLLDNLVQRSAPLNRGQKGEVVAQLKGLVNMADSQFGQKSKSLQQQFLDTITEIENPPVVQSTVPVTPVSPTPPPLPPRPSEIPSGKPPVEKIEYTGVTEPFAQPATMQELGTRLTELQSKLKTLKTQMPA